MKKCNHDPDFATIIPADGAPGIIDIWCTVCGASGSIRTVSKDIQWDEGDQDEIQDNGK